MNINNIIVGIVFFVLAIAPIAQDKIQSNENNAQVQTAGINYYGWKCGWCPCRGRTLGPYPPYFRAYCYQGRYYYPRYYTPRCW